MGGGGIPTQAPEFEPRHGLANLYARGASAAFKKKSNPRY